MKPHAVFVAGVLIMNAAACGSPSNGPVTGQSAPEVRATAVDTVPPAVDGWREYPLREGVVSIQPAKWRSDAIDVVVPAGKGLEYKLTMKAGQGLVYNVSYQGLEHPGMMVVEFHGHTEQVDGVGDLMYYSKTSGVPESGLFVAPWDGIHGWYLKNESGADVIARLALAGFYELQAP